MQLKSKLTAAAIGLLALGGAGTGAAMSASAAPAAPASVLAPANPTPPPAAADNVQSGDQTAPDSPSATPPGADKAGANEAPTVSDGPGGHEDPPGNVDHQSTTEQ